MPFSWDACMPATRGWVRQQLQEMKNVLNISKLKSDLAALQAQERALEGTISADLATIKQAIADLRAKIGAGETVTQADLDALDAQVADVSTGLAAVSASVDAAATDATAPDAPPEPPTV